MPPPRRFSDPSEARGDVGADGCVGWLARGLRLHAAVFGEQRVEPADQIFAMGIIGAHAIGAD